MARELAFSAISARLEARLHARDVRHRPAETSTPAENIAEPAARFVLPSRATPAIFAPPAPSVADTTASSPAASSPDLVVGATFRRKGMLSDIPMPVTRVDGGKVYTSFSDGATSQELAFDPSELELVSKAPTAELPPEIEFFPNLAELVRLAPPITIAGSQPEAAAVEIAAPVTIAPTVEPTRENIPTFAPLDVAVTVQFASPSESVSDAAAQNAPASSPAMSPASSPANTASAPNAAPTMAAEPTATDTSAMNDIVTPLSTKTASAALPPGATRLADGTVQFGYAPTGGLINIVPNKPEPTPPEFGIGATVRRHGVFSDEPLTVTRVGDGMLTATRVTSTGILTYEFPFNQFDLVTAAQGS